MKTTLSQTCTFFVAWVVRTTVLPASARRRSSRIICESVAGSRPEVGSSRKKMRGSVKSSTPMLARLRCPPLSDATRRGACELSPREFRT